MTNELAKIYAAVYVDAAIYITSKRVRKRYDDISDMTLWRWLRDPSMSFPKPMIINRRRYWLESDLDAWDKSKRMTAAAPLAGLPGISAPVAIAAHD